MNAPQTIAGPAYLSNSVANIYTPPAATNMGTPYTVIYQINVANVDSSDHTFTLYKGATGGSTGGTELAKGVTVTANTVYTLTFYGGQRFAAADFLTGLASAANVLTITVMGYWATA